MIIMIKANVLSTIIYILLLITCSNFAVAEQNNVQQYRDKHYLIYIDADFSGVKSSSQAIKQGITTALAEVDYKVQGYTFELVEKNHRANSLRSRKNLEQYLQDDKALLVFSGLHSPPLLSNKSFINNNQILLLDPWAAAGPITRTTEKENWIYRLSIDDTKAGAFITKRARAEGFKKPYLLLEDTGWGRSNEYNMTAALKAYNLKPLGVSWFNWGLGKNHAKLILRNISQSTADVIFLVANSAEGETFAKAMIDLPPHLRLPIRSHWGITGGNFSQRVNAQERALLDLQFIQTRFSFLNEPLSNFAEGVLTAAKKYNPELSEVPYIKAQTGFVHSYDLTKLLIAAINQAGLTGNKINDKLAIHQALISLKNPVKGLLKVYKNPFLLYTTNNPDAHEALRESDYTMGYYNEHGEILLLNQVPFNSTQLNTNKVELLLNE